MEKTEYLELLKHPKWQKRRLEILQRDSFTCQFCSDKETTLHIHHLRYIEGRMPWEYNDEDLMALCEDCHNLVEYFKKEGDPIYTPSCKILKGRGNKRFFILIETSSTIRIIIHDKLTYTQLYFPQNMAKFVLKFLNENIK